MRTKCLPSLTSELVTIMVNLLNFELYYFEPLKTQSQSDKWGQKFLFSQCIIQCENKESWLSSGWYFRVDILNFQQFKFKFDIQNF